MFPPCWYPCEVGSEKVDMGNDTKALSGCKYIVNSGFISMYVIFIYCIAVYI